MGTPSYAQNVHHRPKRTLAFSYIIPQQLGMFGPDFTNRLNVPTLGCKFFLSN